MTTPTRFNYAMVDGVCLPYEASGALSSKAFMRIDNNGQIALSTVGDAAAAGVLLNAATARFQEVPLVTHGKAEIIADTPLAIRDFIKVGSQSRATRFADAAYNIQTTATGVGTSFTTRADSVITIAQAADVAGDRGRGIVLVGTDAAGAEIIETVTLDAANTTTGVDSTLSFTTLVGIYTANGANLGAQNVVATAKAVGDRATLGNGTSQLGANIPAQNQEASSAVIKFSSAVQDNTYLTVVGYKAATPDTLTVEQVRLDNATPSLAETTSAYRRVERICLGELTDARDVRVFIAADAKETLRGRVITAAAARGDTAVVQLY